MSKLKFFTPYYATLGLDSGADDAAIKSAYRRLAKQYHPDRSGDPNTRSKFIEVNQAYEMLMKREEFISAALKRYYGQKEPLQRKEKMAKEAKQRAAHHADMPFGDFEKTRVYRTAMVLYNAFDFVAIGTGMVMIVAPVLAYFDDLSKLTPRGEEPIFHVAPILIGISFIYGVWYFKRKG